MKAIALGLAAFSIAAQAAGLDCPEAKTLEALVACIARQMPQERSNGYRAPDETARAQFRGVYRRMLAGECDFALPPALAGVMQLRSFKDEGNGRMYCVLMEVRDDDGDGHVDRGWGTFVTYDKATNETNHSAPHPIYDEGTEGQAVAIFRDSDARSFMMCGAHRRAHGLLGGRCEPKYGIADCAHQDDTLFQAAVMEMADGYGAKPWTHVQWHGNTTCEPVAVYASQGFAKPQPADSPLRKLRASMAAHQPQVKPFELTGEGSTCIFNATENVAGRFLNGSRDVCDKPGEAASGRFAHIEQIRGLRDPALWIESVRETWGPRRRRRSAATARNRGASSSSAFP